MNKLPQELTPAYERPMDAESVDARMAAQLAFEDKARRGPRELDLSFVKPESEHRPDKERGVFKRALAVAALGATAVGFMLAVERSYDYEKSIHQPPVPVEVGSAHR